MTDEELIARMRQVEWGPCQLAADRIEALAEERDALIAARDTIGNLWAKEKAHAERLEAALRKAIMLAEQPHYGDRDDALDHCFDGIDVLRAALKGADHE